MTDIDEKSYTTDFTRLMTKTSIFKNLISEANSDSEDNFRCQYPSFQHT